MSEFLIRNPKGKKKLFFEVEPSEETSDWSETSSDDDSESSSDEGYEDEGICFEGSSEESSSEGEPQKSGSAVSDVSSDESSSDETTSSDSLVVKTPSPKDFYIPEEHLQLIESGNMTVDELKKLEYTALLRVATHPKMVDVCLKEFGIRGVPLLNHITIRPHQLYVLRWLKTLNDGHTAGTNEWGMRGGIASPTMGLGKTLMGLVDAFSTPKISDFPILTVVSKTVMNVWKLQTEQFFGLGKKAPKFLFLHSQYMKAADIVALNRATIMRYDMIITTYDFCKTAVKGTKCIEKCITRGDEHTLMKGKIVSINLRSRKSADKPKWTGPKVLFGTPFEKIICDESQKFADPDTALFKTMMALYGERKLCLTATSIKNKGLDRWSQYRFLGYNGVTEKKIWKESGERYNRDHGMNRFVMEMTLDDAGIQLPPKYENDIYLKVTGMELEIADIFMKKAKDMVEQHLQKLCSSACILAMLQKLRLVAIAPCLTLASAKNALEAKNRASGKKSKKDDDDDAAAFGFATKGKRDAAEGETDIDLNALINNSVHGKWLADRKGTAGIRSVKILKLMEILKRTPKGEKTVIFSSFTMALDLVEEALAEFIPNGAYQRIDGGTEGKDRETALRDFTYNPKCLWMLMTLKVGGEGIDLTVAKHTVILDPWWNTAAQDQAKARTYRCGQTSETYMYSLYVHDSVEQRVLGVNNEKRELIERYSTGRLKRGAKSEKIDLTKLFR